LIKIFQHHVFPGLVALAISFLFYSIGIFETHPSKSVKLIQCKYESKSVYYNFDTIPEGINSFVSSLKDKENIMLLGSSELTALSPLIPYQFFNANTGHSLTAFGHAFYQSFSMYCNLLAFKEDLKNKKICIIVSPSWFETRGTNTESFLEFIRPEMLSNIIYDGNVSDVEKSYIGNYIDQNENLFFGLSPQMEYLATFNSQFVPLKRTILEQLKEKINVYQFEICKPKTVEKYVEEPNWNSISKSCAEKFNETCSNPYFIQDDLLKTILNDKTSLKKKVFKPIDLKNNQEYKDFRALIQLLKDGNAKPIFVMQGLLPFGYEHLERFDEFSSAIEQDLKAFGFPFLNLFEPDLEKYKPGTLNDFMHMGDLGWNSVNQFIYQNFCHEQAN
jgi:D-alanine transfer protein